MDYRSRLEAAQSRMAAAGLDLLAIGPGSNLYYLTSITTHVSERLYLLLIPQEGAATIILPHLERLAAEEETSGIDLISWTDVDGYQQTLRRFFESRPPGQQIGVDEQLHSRFLLDLQSIYPGIWKKAGSVMRELRIRKSAEEIEIMRKAASIADGVLAQLRSEKLSGLTEQQVKSRVNELLLEGGQEIMQFCIVASGPNGAKPHHDSGKRVLQPGDSVVLDFGGTYRGYQSDMTRMLIVKGDGLDQEYLRVHDVVDRARAAAHDAARPGVTCAQVDKAARDVIAAAGYAEYFVHRTGHGIGVDVHEEPNIVEGDNTVLEVGMTFSIEPGVYLPGRFGVRIEDIAVITVSGEENLNLSSHAPIYVD